MATAPPVITPDLLTSALTYEQYVQLATNLFAQGRTTADDPHYNTEQILGYTKLNLYRMKRLDKLTVLNPALQAAMAQVPERWVWLVLTESWCGDAAQSVPVLHRIAEQSANVAIRFLLRDKNPDVMNAYLTNRGKSIPKLICLRTADSNNPLLRELGTWGPRPAALQALMGEWRAEQIPFAEVVERAQRWYNDDHTQSVQRELLTLVTSWSKISA